MSKFVLVSQSPRRRELLKNLGLEFSVFVPNVAEKIRNKTYKQDIVQVVRAKINSAPFQPEQILIACDTIVVYAGQVLGKPRNAAQARRFLQRLSGQKHTVYSCVALKFWNGKKPVIKHRLVATQVYFRRLTAAEINAYIQTAKPYDKAGAYGIQETTFVRKINGCYYNVVGLPVTNLLDMLKNILSKRRKNDSIHREILW